MTLKCAPKDLYGAVFFAASLTTILMQVKSLPATVLHIEVFHRVMFWWCFFCSRILVIWSNWKGQTGSKWWRMSQLYISILKHSKMVSTIALLDIAIVYSRSIFILWRCFDSLQLKVFIYFSFQFSDSLIPFLLLFF